ncbi:30S ribosomal protein S21 [Porphyridium purpureum]|uniref:30S ribosomal protein S21 n=1 Tax=Porphyridium purpureum TaxID=35688 RepID=A0A5J4YWV1_PORPP|nr:30S ribosomal protein S21 [Porphyridium purpureum]|eukprot:POR5814..scf209_3
MAAFVQGVAAAKVSAATKAQSVCGTALPTPVAAPVRSAGKAALNMVRVVVHVNDGEPVEMAIRRFKREVLKSGHLMEIRNRRYYEPPSLQKQKFNASIKRKKAIAKLLRGMEQ